jgi:hypothetical protein
MKHTIRNPLLCFLGLAVIASTGAHGQQPVVGGNVQIAAQAPLAQGELDALLAPIALYPDQLLAQILMASTYPLQVVTAARFVQQNPSLTGDALDQALRNENWDPSVISLAAYPQVLSMMNDRLDWTQRLGNAFLANQQQVMDTVQALRSRAEAAGNLQSTPQQTVMNQGGFIDIEPAQPQYVYVPVYDPRVIYGSWPDPVYQPDYWYPPPIYGYPDLSAGIVAGIFFGAPCIISSNHWGWAHPNWRGRDIDIDVHNNYFANRPQYAGRWGDGRWTHLPDHRNGVAYGDSGRQDRFNRPDTTAIQARQPYRGTELSQQVGARPAPQSIARTAVQPQPFVRAVPQPPQRAVPPVTQQQPVAHPMLQAPQAVVRPLPRPQPLAQSVQQRQQAVVRPVPQAQAFARAMPQPQQGRLLPASQPQPFAHAPQQRQQPVARPVPQQAAFARTMPQSHQALARPASLQQPVARPMPQRAAAQPSHPPAPRAQVQANANRGSISRPSSSPNRVVTSRS